MTDAPTRPAPLAVGAFAALMREAQAKRQCDRGLALELKRLEIKFKHLDLAALRALWDSEEGEADCDDIHAELNRRGDGEYCAV